MLFMGDPHWYSCFSNHHRPTGYVCVMRDVAIITRAGFEAINIVVQIALIRFSVYFVQKYRTNAICTTIIV